MVRHRGWFLTRNRPVMKKPAADTVSSSTTVKVDTTLSDAKCTRGSSWNTRKYAAINYDTYEYSTMDR